MNTLKDVPHPGAIDHAIEVLRASFDHPEADEAIAGLRLLREQVKWAHHTPALLTDADAAADLAGMARPGAEPVAWSYTVGKTVHLHSYPTEHYYNDGNKYVKGVPLYTTPQASQPLTDDEIDALYIEHCGDGGPTAICEQFARAIEQAHGIGAAQKGKP